MKRVYCKILLSALLAAGLCPDAFSQTVGIGTDYPTATLHIVNTTNKPGARVTRTLAPITATTAAVEINDNSDWGALDIYYANNSLGGVGAYIENSTPLSYGLWATNLNASNISVARFTQAGSGIGAQVYMLAPASAGTAIDVFNTGLGNGIIIDQFSGTSAAYGLGIINYSNNQGGIVMDNTFTSAVGITALMEDATGMENIHFSPVPGASFYADISLFDNLPSSFSNVGFEANADAGDGNGFYFHNDLNGGDGFGFVGFAETVTPTATPTVYGAVFAGEQYGFGHGILVNHDGPSGRNAEFNVESTTNADPALFIVHEGNGGAVIVQNQKSNITGNIIVMDVAYTGADGNSDHIGVYGTSVPSANRGLGVVGEGNDYGVFSFGEFAATGAKAFVMDHPLDPENMILKHFALESDKVLNVYKGNATLDRSGKATVVLPAYFEAINIDFTYQLTAIGTPVQPYISREIQRNSFDISGKPGSKVSWMVIANRHDAYAKAHPDRWRSEIPKYPDQAGKYIDPVSHGKPATMGIYYRDRSGDVPSKMPERPASTKPSKYDKLEMAGLKDEREAFRATQDFDLKQKPPRDEARMPIAPVEIRQQIKTWDEIH